MPRSQQAAVAAIAAALWLLSACMSIGIPRAGEPVVLRPGEALPGIPEPLVTELMRPE